MTAPEFFKQGKCVGHDEPDLFFSDDHLKYAASYTAAAIKVCEDCPVRTPCFEYAYERNEWGIWGGSTRTQRETMRRNSRQRNGRNAA